jgi:transcriptional regulator with XRE-family HTH domain
MEHDGYVKAGKTIDMTVGESVRIVRELQGFSQIHLAELSGVSRPTISAIENDCVSLDRETAESLARALGCHPAVLFGAE